MISAALAASTVRGRDGGICPAVRFRVAYVIARGIAGQRSGIAEEFIATVSLPSRPCAGDVVPSVRRVSRPRPSPLGGAPILRSGG